jgi:putative FmdB family regulatory protein
MPLYEYDCAPCGPFTVQRPMRESGVATACPRCGQAAARRYGVPGGSILSPGSRAAHERNERSAHAPERRSQADVAAGRSSAAAPARPQRPWQLGR